MRRPFENSELIATKNVLQLTAASSHYVNIPLDARWDLAANFTLSILCKINSAPADYNAVFLIGNQASGDLIGLSLAPGGIVLQFYLFKTGSLIFNEAINLKSLVNTLRRFTIIRIGSTISIYENNRVAATFSYSTALNLSTASGTGHLGTNNTATLFFLDGHLGNFIALNGRGLSREEMQQLHDTNILHENLHPYIVAHYPLNQDKGATAYDVVEQYNRARSTPYNVVGYTSGTWTFFDNGNLPTISYGSDSDGNYTQLQIDPVGGSSYYYPVASQPTRNGGAYYKLTIKIKRTAGTGILNLQQFGSAESINYALADLPINTLVTIVRNYIASASTGGYPLVLLSGVSNGAAIGDTYRVYAVENTPLLAPIHGALTNYSSDAVGTTNELLQSAWHNLYEGKKKGKFILKGNGSNMYAQIPGYVNVNPATWSLYVEFTQSTDNVSSDFDTVFCGGDSMNAYFSLHAQGVNNVRAYYNATEVSNTGIGSTTPGQIHIRRFWFIYNGTNLRTIVNGLPQTNTAVVNNVFTFFRFFRQHPANELYSDQGIYRAVFFDRAIVDREINAVEKGLPEYKNFSNKQFDLDFGDVFLSGSDYFIRDQSANNRHAQLFNYNPTTNAPVLIEQDTKLPPVRKALKLNGTNQYLSVTGFNPTKEKGYTYLFGSRTVDGDFTGVSCTFISKFPGATFKVIRGQQDNPQVSYFDSNGGSMFISTMKAITLERLNVICITERSDLIRVGYINGVKSFGINAIGSSLLGWDEVAADLLIGAINAGGFQQFFNGEMFLVGIWKGILKQIEILNILNNTYGANPTPELMADCQLYLNFDAIINDAGTYKIKDWSPQNRTVVMNNYSADEINPGHANYRLIDLDTLR